jgi:S1-C subfamily serine protease
VVADRSGEERPAIVVAESERHDVALLWCTDGWGSPAWLLLDPTEPDLGQEVGMLGYPLGTTLGTSVTYGQGFVSGVRDDDGVPYLQYDLTAAPGSSGGPVFDRASGRVLAVHHGGLSVEGHGTVARFGVAVANLLTLGWLAPHPPST